MKTPGKLKIALGAALTAVLCQSSLAQTLTVDTTEPGGEVAKHSQMGSYTRTFGTNGNSQARGQTFTTADTGDANQAWSVSEFALKKQGGQTFEAGDSIQMWLFEWAPAADADTMDHWLTGDGYLSDGDPISGTTVGEVLVDGAVYALPTTAIAANSYMHFEFDTALELDENKAYGTLFVFNDAAATGPTYVQLGIGSGGTTYPRGKSLRTADTANTFYDQDLTFYVTGTKVAGSGGLKLGSPFQDGMVLQRDKAVSVWGLADASAPVSVSINGTTVNGTADTDGNWSVDLPAMSASATPYQLEVTSNGETKTLDDVLVGDVWIAFGQSNMVRPLSEMDGADTYIDAITNGAPIRCLQVRSMAATSPQTTASMTWHGNSDPSFWTSVGTVFAYENYLKTGVPTAIIWGAWGSSSIEGWMPTQMTNDFPHFAAIMDDYYANDEATAIGMLDGSISYNDVTIRQYPNVIYNRMIHPLLDYGISGFVWYQGEANTDTATEADQYGETLPAFVTEYRSLFGQGDLAFLGVQLPSYNSTYWPWFRESQDQLSTIANAYAAVTIDTGLSSNIHPTDKAPIGQRLSLLAQKYVHGMSVEAHGPTYASMSVSGSDVTISYTSATGLTTDDAAAPSAFEIAGADGVFYDATSASISGTDVVISSTSVATPVYVRYAWLPYAKDSINLVNGDGLPAAPFRTDTQWADPAPEFSADPFSAATAEATVEYSASISGDVSGGTGTLIFSNATVGTTWLSIAEDGTLSGMPEAGDLGINTFSVLVTDEIGRTATAMMTIEVIAYVPPDTSKYVDTFDDGEVETNPGSGGNLNLVWPSATYKLAVSETDSALRFSRGTSSNAGAEQAALVTENKFSIADGFTLDVVYDIASVTNTVADTASFGLIENTTDVVGLFKQQVAQNTFGMSLTYRAGKIAQGITQCDYTEGDADGTLTVLNNEQSVMTGEDKTFTMTVNADGSFTYSIDGKTPTAGTTTFDLSKDYHFAIFSQRFTAGFAVKSVSFVPTKIISGVGAIAMDLSGGGGTNANFSWYGEAGADYQLQFKQNLTVGGDEGWSNITTVSGADADIVLTEEMTENEGFYRVKLVE